MAGRKKQPELTVEEKLQQALVPEAEQPYKVPDNWCWVRLGNIISVSSGKALTIKSMKLDGKIPVYGGNGITGYHNESYIDGENIVIGRVGAYCGSVHYIFGKAWVTDNALIVDFKREEINLRYLYWLLINTNLRTNDSSSAQPVISGSKIYDLPVPFIPLAEQQRIVERIETLFAKLDEAKEKLQNTLDTFETRKSAILHKAFTGELTANWRKQHGLTLDSWKEKTLKSLSDKIGDGLHGTPNYTDNGDYAFINGNNFAGDKIEIKPETKKVDFNEYMKYKVELNDKTVFVSINGTLGKTAFYNNENIILGKSACYINVNQNLNKYYLRHFFCSKDFVNYANEKATGSTIKNLGLKAMRNLKINLPTLDEQTEIVRIIDNLLAKEQQAHSIAQNALAQIDLIKKSILARAFRGQLATNNPADEPAIKLLKKVL